MTAKRIHIPTARKHGEMIQDEHGQFVGFKDPKGVYIGRRFARSGYDLPESPFHNPFSVKKYGREEAIRLYCEKLLSDPEPAARALAGLRGKTLACWCEHSEECHGDVLFRLLERHHGTTPYEKRPFEALLELIDSLTPDITYCTPVAAALVGDCEYVEGEAVSAWELGDEDDEGPDCAGWWLDHGISPEVREARPYERWRANDPDSLRILVQRFEELLDESSLKNVWRKAKQSDGVIINRHPMPEHPQLSDPRIAPEIRPDEPVYGKVDRPHWHGFKDPPTKEYKYKKRNPIVQSGKRKGKLNDHIKRSKSKGVQKLLDNYAKREDGKSVYMGDHFGVNTEEVHYHASPGKYQFPMNPTKPETYSHDHDKVKKFQERKRKPKLGKYSNYVPPAELRANHVIYVHKGVDVKGEHEHTRSVEDRERGMAMRIDVHPAAMVKIRKEDVVFFGIEGCLKADAILTAGGAVFSVPSVTLWQTPALPEFARRYLKGKTVIVVPDADGVTNNKVIVQALLCKSYLERHGVHGAYVAAPPLSPEGKILTTPDGSELKGVDDWLGVGCGTLEELAVQTRVAPVLKHKEYLSRFNLREYGMYEKSKRGMLGALEGLALHHDRKGRYTASVETLCRVTGATADRKPQKKDETEEERDRRELNAAEKRMLRAIDGLETIGALTIDGELKLRKSRYNQTEYDKGDEDSDPVIELIEELQGWNLPPITVGELLGREGARGIEAGRRLKEAG
jgi:hypothetical protein